MDCPAEEGQIRGALKEVSEIRSLQFDLTARTLEVDAPESVWDEVATRITSLGMPCRRLETIQSVEQARNLQRQELFRAIAALGIAVVAELIHLMAADTIAWKATGMGFAAFAIGLAGFGVLRKGWFALTHAKININALMTVAVVGAFLIGDWPEAAMVMALYSIAELIEARAVSRARNAIKGLLNLAPMQAEVRQRDGSWARTGVQSVRPGAVVRVRPGERFAFDGTVLKGHSSADQSAITGESVPVEKSSGDPVFAGTVNQYGELEFEVDKPASDTVLARIIHVVEQAQSARAPIQRFVDRFAAVYTPAVFVIALLVAIGGPLAFGIAWSDSIYKALVLLVIACPCALVISTPVTIVSGLTSAARMGVLIKGGVFLERAHHLTHIALDKTGTLTRGKPEMVASQILSQTQSEHTVLKIARALAGRSDHPVSLAIAKGLTVHGSDPEQSSQDGIHHFSAEPGRGVVARVETALKSDDSGESRVMTYRLGNHRWMHELGLCTEQVEIILNGYEAQGYTLSLLADDRSVLAVFAVADTIRESAREAVNQLQALGVKVVMLTGDNALTARKIAGQAGIVEVRSELLPQDKLDAIRDMQETAGPVGMVGDGINDSPALASADIGFAMGQAGTDIAMEAADVVIMNDDLRRVSRTIELSRKVNQVLWQNISLALGIKAVFLVLAIFDHATMWMAVFADMGASLLVVLNGLRLIRSSPISGQSGGVTGRYDSLEAGRVG
ncbi:heavy metal translocating P-type ATPase [Orrella marina]|uniref:Heavy metal translocating P-type ATPase n=1 Tax=Orrella marina TaxID=2163011 RepID=A0A2R4XPK2_9BURK|nr:heavy metal translocating P-type ATPase [Orrella marina]